MNGSLTTLCSAKINRTFSGNRTALAGTATFLSTHCAEKKKTDPAATSAPATFCDAFHPRVRTVSATCNKRQSGTAGEGFTFVRTGGNSASTFTEVNTRILSISSYLFFYGSQEALTQVDTS